MLDYKERAKRRQAERNTSNWFKLKEGNNDLRIMPTPESKTTPNIFYEYRVHRDVGPKKQMLRCGHPATSDDSDEVTSCWLCDTQIPKLRAKGHEVRAASLTSKDVFVLQVARVDTAGEMTGPFVFSPSPTLASQLLGLIWNPKREYVDAKRGYNFGINRVGTGKNDTKYTLLGPDTDPSVVSPEIIKKLKPFSDLAEIPIYSEAKQKAAYFGTEIVDTDDEEEDDEDGGGDETPELVSRPRHVPPSREEEDNEPEARPRPTAVTPKAEAPKPRAARRPPEPEDDDEDNDDVVVRSRRQVVNEDTEADEDDPTFKPRAQAAGRAPFRPEEEEDIDDLPIDDEPGETEAMPPKNTRRRRGI